MAVLIREVPLQAGGDRAGVALGRATEKLGALARNLFYLSPPLSLSEGRRQAGGDRAGVALGRASEKLGGLA